MPSNPTLQTATASKRVICGLIWLCALGAFGAFRWWVRIEPLNSDDIVLYESSKDAANGDFWLFSDRPRQAGRRDPLCLSCDQGGIGHQALRTGLLPVAVPLLRWLGPTATVYYLVPLVFQLLGAAAVWAWIRRHAGVVAAWVGFGLLALLPYEIDHASRFFVDLPSAACLLWALWLLTEEGGQRAVLRGLGAGSFLAWAYLLRENSPVLVIPSLGLLAMQRGRRRTIAIALLVLAATYGLEQLMFVAKGLGFGFRSRMVAVALQTYAPYLPSYGYFEFAYRALPWFWRTFGGWPLGAVACASLLAGLGALVWALLRSDSSALRALAACGLTTWCAFLYAPLSIGGGRVQALAPVSTRYLQPLFYASFCVAACVLARAWSSRASASISAWARAPGWAGGVALALLGLAWAASVRAEPTRVTRADLPVQQTLARTADVARHEGGEPGRSGPAGTVWGPPLELRVVELFDTQLSWQAADFSELTRQLERAPDTLVLRHRPRALLAQRYLAPSERPAWLSAEIALDETLWNGHHGLGFDSGYTLFIAGNAACRTAELSPRGRSLFNRSLRVARKLEQHVELFGGEASQARAECASCSEELRIELQLQDASGQAQLVASAASGVEKVGLAQPLVSGSNFFAWQAPRGTRRLELQLSLSPEARRPGQLTLGSALLRRCPLPD